MTPGPTLILQLPHCKHLIKYPTTASGNTVGARQWSDGKMEAPMLPDAPPLCKCPTDGKLFWVEDTEIIAEWEFYNEEEINEEWAQLDTISEPSEEDLWAALGTELTNTPERLYYIRLALWWAGNDHIRNRQRKELSAEHLANLTEFEKMLSADDDDESTLLRAEALRELSRFDESVELLKNVVSGRMADFAGIIRDLAEQQYSVVVDINFPTSHLIEGEGKSPLKMEEECPHEMMLKLEKDLEAAKARFLEEYEKRMRR